MQLGFGFSENSPCRVLFTSVDIDTFLGFRNAVVSRQKTKVKKTLNTLEEDPTCANYFLSNNLSISSIQFNEDYTQFKIYVDGIIFGTGIITCVSIAPCVQEVVVPCDYCIPQPVEPVLCVEKWAKFVEEIPDTLTINPNLLNDPVYFCSYNLGYLVDDYLYYLATLNITSNDHPQYITIQQFGVTPLNYGYAHMATVVDDFYSYINAPDNLYATWNGYVTNVYTQEKEVCPPPALLPTNQNLSPIEPQPSPCEIFNVNIQAAYKTELLQAYFDNLKERFIQEYTTAALNSVQEIYTKSSFDKEYHYTLYYYDQAGNLIQTVPPKGVDRMGTGNDTAINQVRDTNPDYIASQHAPTHELVTAYKYNSLNQLVWQKTPDGGETKFAYDPLGRIIASQNAKQQDGVPLLDILQDWPSSTLTKGTKLAFENNGNGTDVRCTIAGTTEPNYLRTNLSVPNSNIIVGGTFELGTCQNNRIGIGFDYENTSGTNNIYNSNGVVFPHPDRYLLYYFTAQVGSDLLRISTGSPDFYDEINNNIHYKPVRATSVKYAPNSPDFIRINNDNPTLDLEVKKIGNKITFHVNGRQVYFLATNSGSIYVNEIVLPEYLDSHIPNAAYRIVTHQYLIKNIRVQTQSYLPAKQTFSYTRYDKLGRIFEAGEFRTNLTNLNINEEGQLVDGTRLVNTDAVKALLLDVPYPLNVASLRKEVVRTLYDEPLQSSLFTNYEANNSLKRVTAVMAYDELSNEDDSEELNTEFKNALHYNYDVHGNVKELVFQNMDPNLADLGISEDQTIKRVQYDYDLISGNVNKVTYQPNRRDQFIHKYTYDADNRITDVSTSKDNVIWEKDASYKYYEHGPLARTELGDKKVQGIDYFYTLQGWLKGVNSEKLAVANDIGKDGQTSNVFARDAFSYSLSYFDNDYKPRNADVAQFLNYSTAGSLAYNKNLYNGNIKAMTTSLMNTSNVLLPTLHNKYRYDQLNRIKGMNSIGVENDVVSGSPT